MRHALVRRALDGELAAGELDVVDRRLELVGDDLARLVDDLGRRAGDGLAADRGRARAVGAEPLRAGPGVAVDDLDVLRVGPEPVGDDLRHRRLQPLAVRRGAGEDGDRAGDVHAHHRRLPQAGLQAEARRAGHARRRQAADLGVGRVADPAQLALRAPRP